MFFEFTQQAFESMVLCFFFLMNCNQIHYEFEFLVFQLFSLFHWYIK